MKTFVSLMMIIVILLSGSAVSPASTSSRSNEAATTENVLPPEGAMVVAYLGQDGGAGGVPDDVEQGRACRIAKEKLKSLADQIRKQTQKMEASFRRALRAAGEMGADTMQAMRRVFPQVIDWLLSEGINLSNYEAIAWAEFALAMFERVDRNVEYWIAQALQLRGVPADQAHRMAQEISDNITHQNFTLSQLGLGHMALHLNELREENRKCMKYESVRNRQPSESRNGKPQGRHYPPVGDGGPGSYFIGGNPFPGTSPCTPGGGVPVNTPTAPQSPAGSDGTAGTVDGGTIDVTASPC